MKNIERGSLQHKFARFIVENYCEDGNCEDCPLLKYKYECKCTPRCTSKKQIKNWLGEEYVEHHHWLPWELEVLKHIEGKYETIFNANGTIFIYEKAERYIQVRPRVALKIKFETLGAEDEVEVMNIDEELARYGMSR